MFLKKKPATLSVDVYDHPRLLLLIIDRETVQVVEAEFTSEGNLLLSQLETHQWEDGFEDLFLELSDRFQSDKVYICLGADLALVTSLEVDSAENYSDTANVQVSQLLGEHFSELGIDYSLLQTNTRQKWVQLFGVKKNLLSALGTALRQAGLQVEAIDPLAASFTQLNLLDDSSTIILWGETYLYAAYYYEKKLFQVSTISKPGDIYNQLDGLISSIETQYGQNVEKVIMATTKLKAEKLKRRGTKVSETPLNPFVGMANKNTQYAIPQIFTEDPVTDKVEETETNKDSGFQDWDAASIIEPTTLKAPKPPLSVTEESIESESQMESVVSPQSNGKAANAKFVILLLLVGVVLIGLVVGGFFVYQNALKDAQQPPEITTVTPTPTPEIAPIQNQATDSATPSGEEVDLSTISANVLNGSGTPGAAGGVADLLEEAGVTEIDTGNADSYDYEETEVRVKSGEDGLYQQILSILQEDYSIVQGDNLDEDSEFDLEVIVGQN